MDLNRLSRGEYIAIVGGVLLLLGLFLPWYDAVSALVNLNDHIGKGTYTGWDAHPLMRFLLIAGALAPAILGWIILRDHALSWPRGQVTSVVAIVAIGLLGYNGWIDRPGDPASQVNIGWGWFVAFVGAVLMLVGSTIRQQETELKRKPPGTL